MYCPVAPQGDPITFKVNKLMSVKNLPYQFYSLPYCRPDKVRQSAEAARSAGVLQRGPMHRSAERCGDQLSCILQPAQGSQCDCCKHHYPPLRSSNPCARW